MNEVRQILIDGDVAAFRRISPEKLDMAQAEVSMHIARTAAHSLPDAPRVYSHQWLKERDIPSFLPDHLLPKAERVHPVIVEAVGICIRLRGREELAAYAQQRIADKVAEMYADGDTDPALVSKTITDLRVSLIGV